MHIDFNNLSVIFQLKNFILNFSYLITSEKWFDPLYSLIINSGNINLIIIFFWFTITKFIITTNDPIK